MLNLFSFGHIIHLLIALLKNSLVLFSLHLLLLPFLFRIINLYKILNFSEIDGSVLPACTLQTLMCDDSKGHLEVWRKIYFSPALLPALLWSLARLPNFHKL